MVGQRYGVWVWGWGRGVGVILTQLGPDLCRAWARWWWIMGPTEGWGGKCVWGPKEVQRFTAASKPRWSRWGSMVVGDGWAIGTGGSLWDVVIS